MVDEVLVNTSTIHRGWAMIGLTKLGLSPKFEFWATLISLVLGVVTSALVAFSYAHGTFLTRTEANDRKEFQDKSEQRLYDTLLRIETKVDTALIEKAKK